ncbi:MULTISPECIES: nuclear transport factor 2 family protein [unclassified Pseudoalteromonas]|uniref:nuclear transport factor 2 family protein n=1 Tax=unclassified Pseudoalteromonas TaxID=194690 RepID=UPI001572712A|nr:MULTISPECIES: nuclear transport factor 2 family protein [unclassified Pseudoalteromonas]MBR8843650.1 nuclear transport factor 2 family protein [Pseudoalteromonas sp. JC3]MCG7555130.1 nuclear transport factor 2 family protein [Pseudoalteromonas sp. Of11M-6]NSY32488.1 nuclear transport factor 2 family protein [Pseudoalteromonas sp. JC28]QUI71123.1 nuclear transport factor 2 family protein [Pseudoalteromonas sp. M8]WJE07317.1 nuclear transport factor 2 family protein [Pseudoalteromonas sp. JC3
MNKFILVLFCFLFSFSSSAHENFTSEQLIEKAKVFVAAKNARQQPNTTIKEIENYISLLSDDFIDEHVKFKFTYTDKSKLREDMINKLKDEVIHSSIEINEVMVGANVVFVKMTESGKVKPAHLDKTIEYSKTNIVSLEFNQAGLVKHIRRHHG